MKRSVMKSSTALAVTLGLLAGPVFADMEAAKKFLDEEIERSALSREEQEAEMQFFIDAAEPFKGMDIKVVSETITTHEYEANVLAPAFTAITGINITHDLIGEGDVVEKELHGHQSVFHQVLPADLDEAAERCKRVARLAEHLPA